VSSSASPIYGRLSACIYIYGRSMDVITRSGLDTCRYRTPAWVLNKALVCSVLEPWDPIVGGPDPIRGGPACTRGGPGPILEVQTIYPGVRHSPIGVRTHC
jgi:hypothetical protein